MLPFGDRVRSKPDILTNDNTFLSTCLFFIILHSQASKAKWHEVTAQTEEEVKLCSGEMFALIDSVSKYKEYMASKITQMKNELIETASNIADIHRGALQAHSGLFAGANS